MKPISWSDVAIATLAAVATVAVVRRVPVLGSVAGGVVPVAAAGLGVYYLALHRPTAGFQLPQLTG